MAWEATRPFRQPRDGLSSRRSVMSTLRPSRRPYSRKRQLPKKQAVTKPPLMHFP